MTWRALPRLDLCGLAVLGLLCGWAVISASVRSGQAGPTVALCCLLAAAYVVGRLTARWAWIVAIGALVWFWFITLTSDRALTGEPLAGPLHYANANAALATQVGAVALIAGARSRGTLARLLLVLASLTAMAMTVVNRSAAGMLLSAALVTLAVLVIAFPPRRARPLVVGATVLLAACVALQLLVAAGIGDDRASQVLSERRAQLWAEALDLAGSDPLVGHGPQTFSVLSATAASDPDTREAHSVLLQTAAELGLVGAALLLALATWGYVVLDRARGAAPAAVGAVAWTAFSLHALVDYVGDYPQVVAMAALALGLAIGPYGQLDRGRRQETVNQAGDEEDMSGHTQ